MSSTSSCDIVWNVKQHPPILMASHVPVQNPQRCRYGRVLMPKRSSTLVLNPHQHHQRSSVWVGGNAWAGTSASNACYCISFLTPEMSKKLISFVIFNL